MSALYVREMFRSWCSALTVPFHDTINRTVRGGHEVWCTAVFDAYDRQRITFCDQTQENGEIELVFLGPPGIGDHVLADAAELNADFVMRQVDPTGALVLTNRGPLEDMSLGDADTTYRLAVRFTYQFNPQ